MGSTPPSAPGEAVCAVCGSVLAAPLVHCPGCRTPHHQDCWAYNDGCAIYGCGVAGTALVPVPAADPLEAAPGPSGEAPRLFATWGAMLVALATLVAAGVVPQPLGVVFGLALLVRIRQVQEEAWQASLPPGDPAPPDDAEALALEQKAVVALIGTGQTARLAQAYALFEARRPRDPVGGAAQRALALELAAGGYRVLAAEAIEKALGRAAPEEQDELERAYRELFRDDPAFAEEAALGPAARRQGRDGPPPGPRPGEDFRGLVSASTRHLACLSRRGLRLDLQRAQRLPGDGPEVPPERTRWLVGPLDPGELEARWAALEAAGAAMIPVEDAELALPRTCRRVTSLVLSQKAACLGTAEGTEVLAWDELAAFFYARVVRIEKSQVLDLQVDYSGKGQQSRRFGLKPREERHVDSLLEIQGGSPLVRYRVETPQPGLFEYLGRRREGSWEVNLRLVAKDLVRFAPAQRAGHGVHAMVSERMASLEDFATRRELEEYLLWFHALGSPRIRAAWAAARATRS